LEVILPSLYLVLLKTLCAQTSVHIVCFSGIKNKAKQKTLKMGQVRPYFFCTVDNFSVQIAAGKEKVLEVGKRSAGYADCAHNGAFISDGPKSRHSFLG